MVRKSWKDRVVTYIQNHSSLYLFICILLVMGVIFGAILVNSLQDSQKQDLYFYLNKFFVQVSEGKFASSGEMFQQSYLSHIKYTGFIWLLGISMIGLPVIFILLFLKGVVVGFTVGFLVNQLGWKGILLSFAAVLPQNLIIIPVFLIMTAVSISFSLRMIRHQFVRKMNGPLLPFFIRYTVFFIIVGVVLVFASAIEAYLSPTLMKTIMTGIK
ncbi:stage II sporulation protein M [Ectobacillus polymachus]|uniref:stage II sporulation protein M n=1 Tax=Ectobacillus polymachus TaxID=1508806 RepID=UPI003A855D24